MRSSPRTSWLWAALVAVAALLASGCGSEKPDLARGKRLFTGEGRCAQCHVLNRAGSKGRVGPNLDEAFGPARRQGLGETTVAGVVEQQIENVRRGSAMPPDLVTGQDAKDVAAYVAQAAGQPGEDTGGLAVAGSPAPTGDPGKRIFIESGCGSCHELTDAGTASNTGPSLDTLGPGARTFKPGTPPEKYIRDSILRPNAYVSKGFKPGVMPEDYAKRLKPRDVDALVAYLMRVAG